MKDYVLGSSPLLDAVEPPVRDDMALSEAGSLTSIAISLKRIADRLELITMRFGDGTQPHGQLNVGAEGNINVALNG